MVFFMSSDAREAVIRFCAAFERRSREDVLAYMAPDIVYQNVPLPAMHGIEQAAKFLAPILTKTIKIEFKLLSLAVSASGEEVLTERLDRLHFPSGVVDIPLMGIFVVRNGKIAQWRDYADNAAVAAGFVNAKVDLANLGVS